MLTTVLDDHPQIACFGELMRRTPGWMREQGYRGALRVLEQVEQRFQDDRERFANPYEFVERVYSLKWAAGKPIVGFKLHVDQHPEFLHQLIADPEYALVILQRDNILAQYSSWLIAEKTGQGNARKGDHVKSATVRFGPTQFEGYVKRMQQHFGTVREAVEKAGKTPFEIGYAELNSNQRIGQLIEFLGADASMVPEAGTEKRNSSDILARFDNPEDTRQAIEKMGRPDWSHEEPQGG